MRHIVVLVALIFGLSAQAGFLLEPYLSSDSGGTKATVLLDSSDASNKVSGISYGARLGYRLMNGLSFGGEYTAGTGKIKDDSGAATPAADKDYTKAAMGAFVGWDRGMFRIWAGYGVSDVATDTTTTGSPKLKGTNMKLGIGVMPIRHFSINFEYVIPKYTKYTSAGSTSDLNISDAYSKYDSSIMAIGISAPFDFGSK